jgi:prepilin-type N-terminal cleavage/methylation domain-containing protein
MYNERWGMKCYRKRMNGFTLIELLVVISIISMLAGQLLPALSSAREKGREANCINNLHQIGIAIEIYYQDYSDYPPWTSCLYKSYLGTPKIFLCLTDLFHGEKGSGNNAYPEANDIPLAKMNPAPTDPSDPGLFQRNPEIEACSYIYEFNPCVCTWFTASATAETILAADTNGDGRVTWKEAKIYQSNHGYGGKVPIVRCFWHYNNHKGKVLNLSFRNYNVYTSGPEWESTSY